MGVLVEPCETCKKQATEKIVVEGPENMTLDFRLCYSCAQKLLKYWGKMGMEMPKREQSSPPGGLWN
jgi:hypothetical protein